MTNIPTLETKAAFARRIGVSSPRITQLVGRGMPVAPDGRVDVAVALAWLDDNLDTSKRTGGTRPVPLRESISGGVVGNASGQARSNSGSPGPGLNVGGPGGPTLAEAKRLHELVKVQRAKLALERERGDLVSKDVVSAALFSWARQERDSWLAWCRRVVPLIATETGANAGTLFAALDRHVREQLHDLAEPRIEV
jgi:hypothetical protein